MSMDDEIIRLKNEREEILKKIALIEEKKDNVRESVYLKVKGDYIAKLNHVDNALKNQSSVITKKLKSIDEEIDNLLFQKESLEEQLEELDLRHSIGEYSDEQYDSMAEELKSHISQIEEKIEFLHNEKKTYAELVQEELVEEKTKKKKTKEDEFVLPEVPKEEKLAEELFEATETSAEKAGVVESSQESVKPEIEDDWLSGLEKELGIGEGKEETTSIDCPKCGFKNKPDAWYCENCGAELQK